MAKSSRIASLAVALTAQTSKFVKKMTGARGVLGRLRRSFKRAAWSAVRFGVAMTGVASIGGLFLFTAQSFTAIDAIAKTADKLGLATEALGAFRHAANLSGLSVQTMEMALQRMGRRIAEAAKGTGEAKGAIAELGLDAAKLGALSPDKQLRRVADALLKVKNSGDKLRLAMKLFDSEGVALINMLKGGSAALDAFAADAGRLGLLFSREDAAKVERFNDAVTQLKGALRGLGNIITMRLARPMERLVRIITGFVLHLRATDFAIAKTALVWAKWAVAIATIVVLVPKVVRGISMIVKAIRTLIAANILAKATSGIGIAVIVAGLASAYLLIDKFQAQFDKLTAGLGDMVKEAEALGAGVADSLKGALGGFDLAGVGAGLGQKTQARGIDPSTHYFGPRGVQERPGVVQVSARVLERQQREANAHLERMVEMAARQREREARTTP